MSNRYYNEKFDAARSHMQQLINVETTALPFKERHKALYWVAHHYLLYVRLAKDLTDCYEQILHPQKRPLLRLLLINAIGRALELKEEMLSLEFREIQFLDDLLIEHQMTMRDMELPISHCLFEKSERVEENGLWLEKAFKQHNEPKNGKNMTFEEAIMIIQTFERARQAKCNYKLRTEIRRKEELELHKFVKKRPEPKIKTTDAVVLIQKIWRGYKARKTATQMRIADSLFLKMFPSCMPANRQKVLKSISCYRQYFQNLLEKNCEVLAEEISEHIEQVLVPEMEMELEDNIREYIHSYMNANGKFPTFPTEEQGGSMLFAPLPDVQVDVAAVVKEVKPEKPKDKGAKGKESKGDKEKDKGKKGDKSGPGEGEEFVLKPSKHLPNMEQNLSVYEEMWVKKEEKVHGKPKMFEYDPSQRDPLQIHQLHSDQPDEEMIRKKIMKEYTLDVHKRVDALMRVELGKLSKAHDKDKGKKGKKGGDKKGGKKKGGKKGGGGGKKGGKKGGGKKGGKKKEKDLTPDRTFESLIEELVEENIVKEYPKVYLREVIGTYCTVGSVIEREYGKDADPCIGDIKRVVKETCIIPLVSADIHTIGPFTKSVLFVGPEGVGKKTLLHAICTESKATLFDLSPANIVGKYPEKSGLQMLMHLVSKVGKRLKPTVIYIEDAEKTFLKKVPKTDQTDPKRLKKELPKLFKALSAEDRILMVGISKLPFDADIKGLCGIYQKVFYVPNPDYNCRRVMWLKYITEYGGAISSKFDLTTLCKVSDGFTAKHFKAIAQQVLTKRRKSIMKKLPLSLLEFTILLPKFLPIYDEEHEAYKAWLEKTPLGKKRVKMKEAIGNVEEPKKDKKKK